MDSALRVAFVGNPNCGKTTLFNAYTGANLKVANWPGVTVEKKEGALRYHKNRFTLVDLPGTYSLTSYTMEEKLTRQYILDSEVDVIVDVADASALERNLYLTLQLIELGKPVVLALNMMDIVEERGMEIDMHRLPEMLGIPCIPVSAKHKTGLDILMHTVAHHRQRSGQENLEHHHYHHGKGGHHKHAHHKEYAVVYNDVIEDKIDQIINRLKEHGQECSNCRWTAIKLLECDEEIMSIYPGSWEDIIDRSYEDDIINGKYDLIEEIVEECLVNKQRKAAATDKADKLMTSNIWGLPIFLGIMAFVFFLTFTLGDFLKIGFEAGLEWFSNWTLSTLTATGASTWIVSLIVNGIIAGVGGILTFLPNIFILFLALAFLEDSGYMSRVAYVMDSLMGKIGLSGRAFIPMILGFGCTVPAIMASRSLENVKDRKRIIFITPFMSCSARLPIYVLFSSMFFKDAAMVVAYSMYLIGIIVAIITALIMNIGNKVNKVSAPLLIELPEYKTPNLHTIFIYVWQKVKEYLTKAGTTIFLASIVLWFLLNFGMDGMTGDMSESFAAIAGMKIAPLLVPAGLGLWQVAVALISGLAAKEVVVSSFSVLFGVANATTAVGMDHLKEVLAGYGFGAGNAYALMVFCLLYVPCVATIGVIYRELKSIKLTMASIVFQLAVAWVMAVLVYQISTLF